MTENEKNFMKDYKKLFDFEFELKEKINKQRIEILHKYDFDDNDHLRLMKLFHTEFNNWNHNTKKCHSCKISLLDENSTMSQRNLANGRCKKCVSIRNMNARNK